MKSVTRLLLLSAFLASLPLRAQTPGRPEPGFNPNVLNPTGSNGTVNAVTTQFDGGILVAGSFAKVGTTARANIARLHRDGTVDPTFNPHGGPDSAVAALAVQPDGKIVVGGGFATYDGASCKGLARLNPDGTLDVSFQANLGTGLDGGVNCLAIQPDGKIVLGGNFGNINGQARGGLARLNPDGTLEGTATFNPGSGITAFPGIRVLAIQPDGKIIVGGAFSQASGQNRSSVARYNANGSIDGAFNPAMDGSVQSISLQPDGKILLGGAFTTVNGQPSSRVARLTAAGVPDGFAPPDILGDIYGILLQADGKFTAVGRGGTNLGGTRVSVARFTAGGTQEATTAFDPGTGVSGNGWCSSLQSDGGILAGGSFTQIDLHYLNSLGRLMNDGAAQALSVTSKARVQWLRGGSAPEVAIVTFELSTDNGGTWTALGPGTRISGGWELTGLNLPAAGLIRARGRNPGANPAVAEQVTALNLDLVTLPPTLVSPAGGAGAAHALGVSYFLPEAAAAGSVQLSFTNASTPRVLTLAAAGESAGAHAFTFDPASPAGSGAFAPGQSIPDGVYSVSLSYRDAAGNPVATSAVAANVTVDTTAPSLTAPVSVAAEAESGAGAVVHFTTTVSDNLDPNPSLIVVPASGTLFPLGVTNVSATARDAMGNVRTRNFSVTVRDTTAPSVAGNFSPTALTTGADGTAALPDFLPQVVASDAVGVTSVVQNPPAGTALPAGTTTVTMTAQDAAGNVRSVSFNVTVADGTLPTIAAPPGGFAPLVLAAGAGGTVALPNYASLAVISDNVGVTSLIQSPPPASARAPGITPVTITAGDAAGNASSVSFNVTVVDVTAPAVVAPPGGFAPLTISTGPDGTAALPDYAAQALASDNVGVASLTQIPMPGSSRSAGVTTVTLTVLDAAQNASALSFDVTVADATKPVITAPAGGFSTVVAQPDGTGVLPDYTGEAVATDNVGVISFTQDPPAGTVRLFGRTRMVLTALDAAGNSSELAFDAFVTLPAPLSTALVSTGGPVPGAGTDPRIAADATFTSFGIPAVDDARGVGFLARWSGASGAGAGVFARNPPMLVVAAGDDVPGIVGAHFTTLQDPVLAPGGAIAFGATVAGDGVSAANDQGVWVADSGGISLALREGGQAPGLPPGALLKSVLGISLRDGELLARCTLLPAAGIVTAQDDAVLLSITSAGTSLLLREGSLVDFDGRHVFSRVAAFDTLLPATGSAGQGRWQGDSSAGARVALADKHTALVRLGRDGSARRLIQTGDAAPAAGSGAYWASFGLPAFDTAGRGAVVKAALRAFPIPGVPNPVTPQNRPVLAFGGDALAGFTIFARGGMPAPGAVPADYATFLDPVINDQLDVAFVATLAGPGVTPKSGTGLFWGAPDSPGLLARLGSPSPDADGTATPAKWAQFISYALPDGPAAGPVFVAKLTGSGVTPGNNLGVWAVDSAGLLRRLLQTGDTVNGEPIIGINTLTPVPGALGAARGFNARGTMVARVRLANGAQSIVRTDVPDGKVRLAPAAR